jgi:hypothetical protein
LSIRKPGKAIDIYHCGLLLLQVALGRRVRFTPEEILAGAPREMTEMLLPQYRPAIEKALRRHVEFRTQSAREFWLDLKNGVQGVT